MKIIPIVGIAPIAKPVATAAPIVQLRSSTHKTPDCITGVAVCREEVLQILSFPSCVAPFAAFSLSLLPLTPFQSLS
jgi:hypothetical protein